MYQQFRAYTDVFDLLLNGTLSVETASLVGGNSSLANPISAGALSVQCASQADAGNFPGSGAFPLWILDGQNSEIVMATASNPRTTTFSIAAPGTFYPHSAGVNLSSAGIAGCLAALIREASSAVETICRQGPDGAPSRSLYQQQWVERLSGPSFQRATFDVDGSLLLHPYRFPIVSASSVTVQMGATTPVTIDLSFLMLSDAQRMLAVPMAQVVNTAPPTIPFMPVFSRRNRFVATLTYVGGPIPGATLDSVQPDIRKACTYLVLDRLSYRQNTGGFASARLGDKSVEARLRGDTSGHSLYYTNALEMLEPYTQDW